MSDSQPTVSRARLKDLASLKDRKGRLALGLQLLEGPRLVGEALAAGRVAEILVAGADALAAWRARSGGVPVHEIPRADLDRIADVRTPQEVVAVGPLPEFREVEAVLAASPAVLFLDAVQDPGNCGTLVRTAAALGAGGVVFGPGSADPTNPKVLRASAGAVFRVSLGLATGGEDLVSTARASGHRLVVPVARGGADVRSAPRPARYLLVAGNEGAGSSFTSAADALRLTIPMSGGVESLNVAAACAVILGRWLPL